MIASLPVDNSLRYLIDAALIRRLNDAEPAYMIKHALVQDTAQATLLKNEIKRLHLLVGSALERVNAAQLDEYAAELAHHFARAEDERKTFEYSLRAGDVAARVFANAEALAHYDRAIAIAHRGIVTPQQIIRIYTQRGRILEITGRYPDALASYLELHQLAEQRGDRSLELAYLMLRAPLHSAAISTFDAALAKQLLLDAFSTARELGDEVAEARVLWNLSMLSVYTMHPAEGVINGELSLALAVKLNLREQQGYTLHDLFMPYRATGQIARARQVQEQARAIFREIDNKTMLADNLGVSAQFTLYEGELEHALEFATEGLAASRAIGNPFGVFFNHGFRTTIYYERGEYAIVLDALRELRELIERDTSSVSWVGNATLLAAFLGSMGALVESERLEHLARETQWEHIPLLVGALNGSLARIRLLHGDTDGASADIANGMPNFVLNNATHPVAVQMPFAIAELALVRREYPQVIEASAELAEWARVNEYRLILTEALLLQGRAYLGMQDTPNALATLKRARALADLIGTRRLQWQILAGLDEGERLEGNASNADAYRARTRTVLEYMIEQTPPEYRAGFLKLPRVRES